MSRKHYKAMALNIAQAMADADTLREKQIVELLAARFADFAAHENPRFDRARFLEACNIER